jgi:Mlc titration factor MtfA (ptsG expression regulator)
MKRILEWFRSARVPRAEPFPDDWASFLWDHSAHYRRLPGRLQTAFEQDALRFIATRRITGVKIPVDDPLRLLVAASAVTLSVGWPGYKWSEVSEVLLYPDDFDRDYAIGQRELAGIAHVWGTVILSVPSLWHSFTDSENRSHLGFHEFAHLLTFERGLAMRVPIGLSPERIQLWERIEAQELKRIGAGDSIVDPYALQPAEFFTCAVEAFFQKPIALRERHRRLYGFLGRYFRQSPATWESRLRARTSPASRGGRARKSLS